MDTERKDIGCAYRVARAGGAAMRASVYPAVSAPPPAYGTRLRAVSLVNGNRASGLVIQLLDDLAGTRLADSLRLGAPGTLGGVVKGLAHIAPCTGERLGDLPRRLVAQITDAPLGPVEHPVLAALQPLVAPRAFRHPALALSDAGELLVAVLDRRLGGTPADEHDFLPVSGGDQGIHAQVYPDHSFLGARGVSYLADQTREAIRQPDFHQPSWQRDRRRQANAERAASAMGQYQPSVLYPRILVGIHHIVIAVQPPRIARLSLAVLAQLAAGVDRLAELADELLCRLCGQAGIAPLGRDGPPLPAQLARPTPAQAADTMMAPTRSFQSRAASRRLVPNVAHLVVVRGLHASSTVR
jgi:hypothetical protein